MDLQPPSPWASGTTTQTPEKEILKAWNKDSS